MQVLTTIQLDKKYFPLPLQVEWLDGKRWKLLAPFEYIEDGWKTHRAEKGFIFDFGSKPWFTWSLIGSPTDEGGPAYVIHDFHCKYAKWPRITTDRIFLKAMRDCGVAYLKRKVQYYFVRIWSYF